MIFFSHRDHRGHRGGIFFAVTFLNMSSMAKLGIEAVVGKMAGYFKETDFIPDNYTLSCSQGNRTDNVPLCKPNLFTFPQYTVFN
jgi:hypothetical protein